MSFAPPAEVQPSPDFARRRLLLGGASLLVLGLVLNASRVWPAVGEDARGLQDGAVMEDAAAASTVHRGEAGVMGGPEVGQPAGVGGLGLVGTGRGGGGTGEGTIGLGNTGLIGKGGGGRGYGAGYGGRFGKPTARGRRWAEPSGGTLALPRAGVGDAGFIAVASDRRSTFSIDVDTASYSATRRSLLEGRLPEPDAVRIEELVNYFDYDYPAPTGDVPFSIVAEVGECPWQPEHELVHIGLQGEVIAPEDLPPRNLVFLVDVSGSMQSPDKLPLVKQSLSELVGTLRAEDRISLVVYAGAAGVVLPPTAGSEKATVLAALERLGAGGSTNGAEGIAAAYAQARAAFMKDGVNRVILASDGDFNVGVSSHDELVRMIEKERKTGVELSVLGYGMGHRDHTMEQLADRGNGNYAYIDGLEEAHKVLVEEAGGTLVTIAKDVKIQVELDPARVLSYRLVGYENRRLAHRDFADDTKDAGEIGAGHSVTALYEVVPRPDAPAESPWMTVSVRYKPPKGQASSALAVPVVAEPRALADTSEAFRFAAAVASFGMLLRDPKREGGRGEERVQAPFAATWASTQALARGALGEDVSCRRHRFVELVGKAGALAGDREVSTSPVSCTAEPLRSLPPEPAPELPAIDGVPGPEPYDDAVTPDLYVDDEPEASEWGRLGPWVLEVLRLLPPLLALPLFVMALRRPRRRR